MFGITDEELVSIKDSNSDAEALIKQHAINNPLLITDLDRKYIESYIEVHNSIIDTFLMNKLQSNHQ